MLMNQLDPGNQVFPIGTTNHIGQPRQRAEALSGRGHHLGTSFPARASDATSLVASAARLIKDNARLREEGKQLRAAINVYRELANRALES